MGEWSEAMEDGVICRGCALPLAGPSGSGYCPDCQAKARSAEEADSPGNRADPWKAGTGE
jgi:uncharacterized Zn finger protein (UPF0148 family)